MEQADRGSGVKARKNHLTWSQGPIGHLAMMAYCVEGKSPAEQQEIQGLEGAVVGHTPAFDLRISGPVVETECKNQQCLAECGFGQSSQDLGQVMPAGVENLNAESNAAPVTQIVVLHLD